MKQDLKICFPVYKIVYSAMFLIILSLARGISAVEEIGGALDSNIAILALVFCAETYVMEKSGGRGEIFALFPIKNRIKAVRRRLIVQNIYLCALSYLGFFFFFWQRPRSLMGEPLIYEYGLYILAVTCTIFFWSMLAMTISNIFGNQWAGIGIGLILWMVINSTFGMNVLGKFSIFAYGDKNLDNIIDMEWIYGKILGTALALIMLGAIPYILKKRG